MGGLLPAGRVAWATGEPTTGTGATQTACRVTIPRDRTSERIYVPGIEKRPETGSAGFGKSLRVRGFPTFRRFCHTPRSESPESSPDFGKHHANQRLTPIRAAG